MRVKQSPVHKALYVPEQNPTHASQSVPVLTSSVYVTWGTEEQGVIAAGRLYEHVFQAFQTELAVSVFKQLS